MAQSTAQRQATWRRRHPVHARAVARSAQQKWRDAIKESKAPPPLTWPDPPADPAGALCDWARDTLIVPPGHPNAGARLELPPYLLAFFKDALAEGCTESLNCVARKNGKSAAVAVLVLGYLVGPLRREGWRCALASLSREKAAEIKMQIESIATASGLEGVSFWRRSSPAITAAGGIFVSANMPAKTSTRQKGLLAKTGAPGSVASVFFGSAELLSDPWSGSPRGERRLTLLSFHEALTLRKDGFAEASFKLS